MRLPISELVDRNVEQTLRGVSVQAGAAQRLQVEWFNPHGNQRADWKAVIICDDDQDSDHAADGYKGYTRPYWIMIFVPYAQSETMRYQQKLNLVRSDVERPFLKDNSRGGTADVTTARPSITFDAADDGAGIIVRIDVAYSHFENDPTSK